DRLGYEDARVRRKLRMKGRKSHEDVKVYTAIPTSVALADILCGNVGPMSPLPMPCLVFLLTICMPGIALLDYPVGVGHSTERVRAPSHLGSQNYVATVGYFVPNGPRFVITQFMPLYPRKIETQELKWRKWELSAPRSQDESSSDPSGTPQDEGKWAVYLTGHHHESSGTPRVMVSPVVTKENKIPVLIMRR
ncbi:hypothetical protein HAX54_034996, partial [Datura stramonium]|nr:hypothetical protein [Datura stramonium]